ncbi:N-alpha-acetyltransferase 50 [Gurleya vavrai]
MHKLRLDPVDIDEIDQFKHIQNLIFPVSYPPFFYKDLISSENHLGYFIKYDEKTIGVVTYRIDPVAIYIMTFGILQNYRGYYLGSCALYVVEAFAIVNHKKNLMCLHVNVSNRSAVSFYTKNGFSVNKIVKDYYVKTVPRDAYILYKVVKRKNEK